MLLTKYSQWSHFLLATALRGSRSLVLPTLDRGILIKTLSWSCHFSSYSPQCLSSHCSWNKTWTLTGAPRGLARCLGAPAPWLSSPSLAGLPWAGSGAGCSSSGSLHQLRTLPGTALSLPTSLPLPFPDGQPWSTSELLFHFPNILYFLYIHI